MPMANGPTPLRGTPAQYARAAKDKAMRAAAPIGRQADDFSICGESVRMR